MLEHKQGQLDFQILRPAVCLQSKSERRKKSNETAWKKEIQKKQILQSRHRYGQNMSCVCTCCMYISSICVRVRKESPLLSASLPVRSQAVVVPVQNFQLPSQVGEGRPPFPPPSTPDRQAPPPSLAHSAWKYIFGSISGRIAFFLCLLPRFFQVANYAFGNPARAKLACD